MVFFCSFHIFLVYLQRRFIKKKNKIALLRIKKIFLKTEQEDLASYVWQ